MTAQDAFQRKIEPFEGTVFAEGFECVLRTGGSEAAGRGSIGRNAALVKFYQQKEGKNCDFLDYIRKSC